MDISVSVKKTILGLFLLNLAKFIVKLDLIKREKRLLAVLNKLLCNDLLFKYKVGNGKWHPIKLSDVELCWGDDH